MGNRNRISIMQSLKLEVRENLKDIPHDPTRKQYFRDAEKFIRFCREKYNAKTLSECKLHLQDYSDHLVQQGYTASTIHTYLAAACRAIGEKNILTTIKKPIRKSSEFTRGRNFSSKTNNIRLSHTERFRDLLEFQEIVGIRRSEISKIKGSDLVYDESGYLCVRVKSGKGGKFQLNKCSIKDYTRIRRIFENKRPDELLFPPDVMQNKLNLHAIRAERAREAYSEYVHRIKTEPGYSKILEAEILARWNKYNINPKTNLPKRFDFSEIQGEYILRGENRKFAQEHGLPIHYNKLATMATSIFVLSHWRNNVTVTSYLLAI